MGVLANSCMVHIQRMMNTKVTVSFFLQFFTNIHELKLKKDTVFVMK